MSRAGSPTDPRPPVLVERPSRLDEALRGPDLTAPKILIVDDVDTGVVVLRRLLEHAGFECVVGTTDASGPLENVHELQPDLVLLGVRLTHVDGYELLAHLRRTDGFVPVIVLTADTSAGAKRRCLEAGANDVLTKPFDGVEVMLRIRNLLELRRLPSGIRDHASELERLVTERTAELNKSLDGLRRMDRERRQLLTRLVDAQERERQRIAADIHDDPIQKMTALAIRLEGLLARLDDPAARDAIAQSLETTRDTISRLRRLLFLLRLPALDESGLVPALSELLDRLGRDTGVRHSIRDELTAEPPIGLRATAYRIAQEAITNVGKHAKATCITVTLQSRDGGISVRIEDDGVGPPSELEPKLGHLGLTSMQERAQMTGGWLRFGRADMGGASVEVWLPTNGADAAS